MTVIGVIGCGRIANNAHLPALSGMEDVRIKYACDILIEKAKAAKEIFPKIEQVAEDYHTVLADPEIEAVWVLTPNAQHYTIAMDALRAGKHVLCEKPIAVSYDKAAEMAKTADECGKLLNIGVCNRYNLSVEKLAQMNARGDFGKIYHVVCSFRSCRSIPGIGGAFTTKAISGGGALIDWGVHFLDLILYVLGGAKPLTVSCDTYGELGRDMKAYKYRSMWAEDTADKENGTYDVDDYVAGHIRTDKATITLNGAWAQNLDRDEMYVDFLGDKGGARLEYGKLFEFFHADTLETDKPRYEIPSHYVKEDEGFLQAIRTGEKTKTNIDNVLASARMMEAMYESSEKHREVVIG